MSDVRNAIDRVNMHLAKNPDARKLLDSNPVARATLNAAVNAALSYGFDVATLRTGDDWSGGSYAVFLDLGDVQSVELVPHAGMHVPAGAEWCDENGRWWPERAKVFGPAEVAEWKTGTLKWRYKLSPARCARPHARVQYPAYVDHFAKVLLQKMEIAGGRQPAKPTHMGIVPVPGARIPENCDYISKDAKSPLWCNVVMYRGGKRGLDLDGANLSRHLSGSRKYRVPYSSEPLYLDVVPEDGKPVPEGCQKRNALGAWLDFPPCSFSDRHAAQYAHGQRWRVKAATYPL